MAGYVTKQVGHVFDGAHYAGEPLENGQFVKVDPTTQKVNKLTAPNDLRMTVVSKEELWGMPALRCDVLVSGSEAVYFVENEWVIDDTQEYDTSKYTLPAGKMVKMKILLPGEQIITTVTDAVYSAAEVGKEVVPGVGGALAIV